MKFTCDKIILNEVINSVSLAVASKSTLLSLEGILLRCNNNILTLTGYNLELGIIKSIPVQNAEDGEIVLPASLFCNIINKMPNSKIDVSVDNKLFAVIRCEDIEFTILGLKAEDYPEIPSISKDKSFSLDVDVLKGMISQTLFAVAQTDQNPVFKGCLFEIVNGQLLLVTLDGCRLALRKENIDCDDNFNFLVPGKTLTEIQKLISKVLLKNKEEQEKIYIRVSNRHIIFELDGYNIISRLIEGDIIDYRRSIPNSFKTRLRVKVRDFIDCINRASIIINDMAKSPIRCEMKKDSVKLFCKTSLGQISDSFFGELTGEEITLGFNNKYMSDALKASDCDEVYIETNGPLLPIKITPLDGDDFLFIVMPIKIRDEI